MDIHDLCGILPKPSKIITIEEMKKVGSESMSLTPYEFKEFVKKETIRYQKIINDNKNSLFLINFFGIIASLIGLLLRLRLI